MKKKNKKKKVLFPKTLILLLLFFLFINFTATLAADIGDLGGTSEEGPAATPGTNFDWVDPNWKPPSQAGQTSQTTPPSGSSAYFNQEKIPGAASTSNFVDYVKQIIRFGFATIGILALFMLSVGAYQYLMAAGNLAKMESARETIYSALFGLILGLTAFLILRTINPQLVSLQLTSPGGGIGTGTGTGTGSTGAGGTKNCEPELGNCRTSKFGCFGSDAEKASRVCGYESVGGNPYAMSGSDKCSGGESYSVGLFQINLTAHDLGMDCRNAFNGTNNNCTVVNQKLYQSCVAKAKNEQFNIDYACQLYGQNGFSPWKNTVRTCGL